MKIKKDASPVSTSEPYYDLFEGGYIKPDELLEAEDAGRVKAAVNLITSFFAELEDAGLIEET